MADCQLGSSAGILLLESFDKNLDRSISKIKGSPHSLCVLKRIYGFLPGTGFHYRIAIDYLAARLEGFQTSHWTIVRANESKALENLP